jgi:hypothetical protein
MDLGVQAVEEFIADHKSNELGDRRPQLAADQQPRGCHSDYRVIANGGGRSIAIVTYTVRYERPSHLGAPREAATSS